MQPLSEHRREELVRLVARELAWTGIATSTRDTYLYQARRVVSALEETGIHGACILRAAEKVMKESTDAA